MQQSEEHDNALLRMRGEALGGARASAGGAGW